MPVRCFTRKNFQQIINYIIFICSCQYLLLEYNATVRHRFYSLEGFDNHPRLLIETAHEGIAACSAIRMHTGTI